MVGIVIVSHSGKVAEGVVELCRQMAAKTPMAAAGGLPDGGIGTDFQRIFDGVQAVDQGDGVVILFDMGSALMTTEMVVEACDGVDIRLADAPLVEGAIAAAIAANMELCLDVVLEYAQTASGMKKLD